MSVTNYGNVDFHPFLGFIVINHKVTTFKTNRKLSASKNVTYIFRVSLVNTLTTGYN